MRVRIRKITAKRTTQQILENTDFFSVSSKTEKFWTMTGAFIVGKELVIHLRRKCQ